MLFQLATLVILVAEAVLATYVAARAWDYQPARFFVLVVASLMLSATGTFISELTSDLSVAYAGQSLAVLGLGLYDTLLLVLIGAIFVPQWWQGARPIRWIVLPFVVILGAMALDLLFGLGIFVRGGQFSAEGYDFNLTNPGGRILILLFTISWLVHLVVLGYAFVRQPRTREVSGLLFVALIIVLALSRVLSLIEGIDKITGVINSAPMLLALAYAVVRTRLLVPTRAALDMALHAMSETVAVLDTTGKIVYANPRAAESGFHLDRPLAAALLAAGVAERDANELVAQQRGLVAPLDARTLALGERLIEITLAPVADRAGQIQGTLLLGRDVTEVTQRTAQLEQERARLSETVAQLEAEQQERAQLAATVQGLSLPLIPVLEGVLVLPLIGAFDMARADEFIEVLLQGIERDGARLVLIDLTGIPLLDTQGAAAILRGVRAAGLLGARCVLAGVRPEIAQALVAFDVSLEQLTTAPTLQRALETEMELRTGSR
jgi:anti-anti-sigma regulatory factor/PAS domain-containing protein